MTNRLTEHPSFKNYAVIKIVKKFNIRKSLDVVSIDGRYFEFGVYRGSSINYIASLRPDKTIYGFDSLQGLPEEWRTSYKIYPKGHFSTNGELPTVANNVVLVSGWFEDSLPEFCNNNPTEPTAFIHIDADLYSSAKTIFKYLGHTFVPGTVIVFDEWFSQGHEDRAFMEWLEENDRYACAIISTDKQRTFIITQ